MTNTSTCFASAIRFNRKSRTIEITKSFDKAASRFGTDEYNALLQARKDHPSRYEYSNRISAFSSSFSSFVV